MTTKTTLPPGVIDVTDLSESMKDAWATWAREFILSGIATVPGLFFLRWPVIAQLFDFFLVRLLDYLAGGAVMQAFFLNTALRKSSQAQDFIRAVHSKKALPPSATDEEYKNAEKNEMEAFRNFVRVTQ